MKEADPVNYSPAKAGWWHNTFRTRVGLGLFTVLAALVAGTWMLSAMGKKPEILPEAPLVTVTVKTEKAAMSDVAETVTFAGLIEADPTLTLAFDVGGTVATVGADKGARVAAGQVLMTLDDRLQAAALDKAGTALRQADDDLRRFTELKKTGAVSDSDFDGTEARADMAAATLKEAQAYYDKCRILSPIAGVIEDRMIDVGEFAAPGIPVVRVANTAKLKILIDVPERDVFTLKSGQDVPVVADALAGRVFAGQITYVAAAAEPKSNTFRVEIGVADPDGELRPGVIVKVTLTRRVLNSAVSVPLAALIPSKGQYIAYVTKDGHAIRRVVKLVAIVGARAVVLDGILAGETVITDGQRLVSDGVAIREPADGQDNASGTAGQTTNTAGG
ncbi:MAG: efflux RND transporter periplasmic adaptor subunit [bacterium]